MIAPNTQILLVSCYELGHQPLGVAVPAGVLERAGFRPMVVDLAVEKFDEGKAATASLVCISVPMHTAMKLGVRVALRVRQLNPDCHICFYGIYAGLNRDYLMSLCADTCLGGEFEGDLLRLAEAVAAAPRMRPRDTTIRESNLPVARRHRGLKLLPQRDLLPEVSRYARLLHQDTLHPVGYVTSTRGCKHLCMHCPLAADYAGSFYAVSSDTIMQDVATLADAGASHITFADPDFLNGPLHALRVARTIHAAYPHMTFDFTAKIEHLHQHPDLLREMVALGCLFVVSAVESLNDDVLSQLRKRHTRADALAMMRYCAKIGLALRPSLLPFTPWETADSYVSLLDTIAQEGMIYHVDAVQYSVRLLVPPGSLLLDSPGMQPHLGDLDAQDLTYSWKHPDPAMDRLQVDVAAIVRDAAESGEDPGETFYRVQSRALSVIGGKQRPVRHVAGERPPRLTEPWFC